MRTTLLIVPAMLVAAIACSGTSEPESNTDSPEPVGTDTIEVAALADGDSVVVATEEEVAEGDTLVEAVAEEAFTPAVKPENRHGRLTEQDYIEVARELGVEVAAIKAVVDIEAGAQHKGFWKEGHPIINFDLSMYRPAAKRRGLNLGKYAKSHAVIFSGPNAKKYGSQQAGQQARLDAAMSIDRVSAIEGTFWGMFQIGGFNYKKCGTKSHDEFVKLMSRSERDQLELFAEFIKNTGLLKHLKAKNWSAFARGYNGTSYASRGYHTKLANSYAKHKRTGK